MYGMVNKAIKQLILDEYGSETWDRVFKNTDLDTDDFYHMEQYDDTDSVALVVSASTVLDMTPVEFLVTLGEYWISYAMNSDYGDLLEMAGDTLPDVLENLDAMHSRVGDSFEELRPPSFWTSDVDESSLHLHYASDRQGLAPMVIGLVKGLGKRFNLTCVVTHIESAAEGANHDTFEVTYSVADVKAPSTSVATETA